MGKPTRVTQLGKFVTTREVFTLRKDLKGLVIGQTDKNLNELWCMCPKLYDKAWDKAYVALSEKCLFFHPNCIVFMYVMST